MTSDPYMGYYDLPSVVLVVTRHIRKPVHNIIQNSKRSCLSYEALTVMECNKLLEIHSRLVQVIASKVFIPSSFH